MNRPDRPGQLDRRSPAGTCVIGVAVILLLASVGCASSKMATLRSVPKSPLVDQLNLTASDGPKASPRTRQFLRVHGLQEGFEHGSDELLAKVQEIIDREPSADNMYALAELNYLAAKNAEKQDTQLALELYEASVLHAYQYLFDEQFRPTRNPYDPHFRAACDLYNGALEAGLRLICRDDQLKDGSTHTIHTAGGIWDITCELRGGRWGPQDIDHFEFVSDYEIHGLKNHYQTYGLGVPLIAVRRDADKSAMSRYYPPGLAFPVTAFLRPVSDLKPVRSGDPTRHHGVLELYDPLTTTDVGVGPVRVPLESDLTTPLAYFLSNPKMSNLGTVGLLHPEKLLQFDPERSSSITGLYMVQAYEPGKIPVLLVHGLWSSPMTWIEMFNDLRSSPEIRDHYQFWFYLYPTAEPFWVSAARLRKDLADMRQVLDPQHRQPALDQTVLIGHSMGGLVSRLQTIDSRDDFWRIISDQPFQNIKADPEVRQQLANTFFFRPNPSVRRVVTIGTPHRGSSYSNLTTQWIMGKLVQLPGMLIRSQEALFRDNKELIRDDSLLKIETSIDSLSPKSPFFPVMLAAHEAPWVKYHNIVGLVPKKGLLGSLMAGSDGVVSYDSAHMDDVQSELTIAADHTTVHGHPLAVLEVRRILLEHLAELQDRPQVPGGRVQTAAAIPSGPVGPPRLPASRPPYPATSSGPDLRLDPAVQRLPAAAARPAARQALPAWN
jgi:pimeloyl-ACP methyl ester carboxylesterase